MQLLQALIQRSLQKDWDSIGRHRLKTFHVCCVIGSVCLSLTLGALFAWHVYLTSRNLTTIEVDLLS
ncbi:UNVERIFIED_CONTAM: hypothetical protein Sradi_1990600 [Sesamum radiatum]|uniref:Uncharacterized protein n=1 Tax=Sesamum radiatum TaxID=300843 RepID=A0AAW2TF28_SESRA